ncbi:ABC transporter permease [Streptosporangium sp. KLBMP 9127]|nr:ABC transporter permease [Streptosporangium sp. KLBMP 9127]
MMKTLTVETKLFLRDPASLFFAVLLPTVLLLGLSSIPSMRDPIPELGGQAVIDTHMPAMMTVLAVVMLAFTVLPAAMAMSRESGQLRRMSTTPVSPSRLIIAQVLINVGVAIIATGLMIVLVNLVHGVAMPRQPLGFLLVFLLGSASVFAVGLLIGALAPTAKSAPGIGSLLMFPLLFVSGMWMPREAMADLLRQVGDFLPVVPFGQALRDTWGGAAPAPLNLVVMTATLLLAGGAAVRFFKWE